METIVSIAVQVCKVSATDRLKYSLNSQNAPSLMCDSIRLPAPIANTMRFGSADPLATSGATKPAVVRPATVADPTHTRTSAAIAHATKETTCHHVVTHHAMGCSRALIDTGREALGMGAACTAVAAKAAV